MRKRWIIGLSYLFIALSALLSYYVFERSVKSTPSAPPVSHSTTAARQAPAD